MRTGRPKSELILSPEEKAQLEAWIRRGKSSQWLSLWARIVLECSQGMDNKVVAKRLG